MKKMKECLLKAYVSLSGLTMLSFAVAQNPQVPPATDGGQQVSAYECTQVAIEDIDPALLTKQERIALLDGNLQDSINNYSTCVSAVQQSMGNGEGIGGGGDSEGQGAGSASSSSQPLDNQGAPPQEVTPPIDNAEKQKNITPSAREVIAPKDNDKIICKLLFQEIQKVDDPDMLAGLKEQYSNYQCG